MIIEGKSYTSKNPKNQIQNKQKLKLQLKKT